jgi:hypothetical protein
VTVSISALTPGRAAFAVKVSDVREPDRFVVSDIFEVDARFEGTVVGMTKAKLEATMAASQVLRPA